MKWQCRKREEASRKSGMTLIDMMIAVALGAIVLAITMVLYTFGLRSFGSMGNYAEMDAQSRNALDFMSREIRQSSLVIGVQNSGAVRWLRVANTNTVVSPLSTNTFTWDTTAETLVWEKTGQPARTLLTGCDKWTFSMYQRTPTNDWNFFTTTNLALCKMINMSWRCSRTNIIRKFNSESMVTAEVVLRNKP
jgi:hypothetical protein